MKKQRVKSNQDSLEKQQRWRTYTLDTKIYQKATLVETEWHCARVKKYR